MQLSAWLAATVAALVLPSAFAQAPVPVRKVRPKSGQALWTDVVTSCSDSPTVRVHAFDLVFHKENQSLAFTMAVDSKVKNLDWEAKLHFNAYDLVNITETFDMCSYLDGALCKIDVNILPNFNISGFGNAPVPGSMSGQIPKIAWMVPNLDAYARVELINRKDGSVGACLQTTLTNGWSVEVPAVAWVTGAFTLLAVLLAIAQSIRKRSSSPALYRWFDILSVFQNAALAGCMNLKTPLVWVAFTRNFAWSLGLMYIPSMQTQINKFRKSGGGSMPYTANEGILIPAALPLGVGVNLTQAFSSAQNAVAFFLQQFSQKNIQIDLNDPAISKVIDGILSGNITSAADIEPLIKELGGDLLNIASTAEINIQRRAPVTTNVSAWTGSPGAQAGVENYINAQSIPTANAMSTVFFWLLLFLAVLIAAHFVIALPVVLLKTFRSYTPKWSKHLRRTWWQFCAANFFRFCLAFAFPVVIWSFSQWKIGKKDATAPIILSVVGWVIVMVPLIVVFVVSLLKNNNHSDLHPGVPFIWTDYRFFHAAGVLFRPYKPNEHYFWFNPILVGIVTKAGFIIFGAQNQWAQVIGCMAVEVLILLNLVIFRSYRGIWNNMLGFLLTFFRLAMFGLCVAYIESVKVKGIPRTIMGVAQIAVVAIPTILLFIDMIWQFFYDLFHFNRRFDDFEDLDTPYLDENEKDPSIRAALVHDSPVDRAMSPPFSEELKGGDTRYVAMSQSPAGPGHLHDPFQSDPYDYNPGNIYETNHAAPSHNHGYGYTTGYGYGGNNRTSAHAL